MSGAAPRNAPSLREVQASVCGHLVGSRGRGALSCLVGVNPVPSLFQTGRTSPFCARKCSCRGGRCVVPSAPALEDAYANPGR